MRVVRSWLLAVLLMAVLAACDSTTVATPTPTTITIAGSTAMRRMLQDLTAAYSRQHSDVLFVLRGGGSSIGEGLVRSGEVDLGASTLFAPAAASDAVSLADTLVRTPIGLDGLALVVHPSNNVEELSLVQLQQIFSGRVLDWLALGSDAGEIQLVSREDGSGARILFELRVMGQERVSLTAVVMPTSADVVEYIAKNPAAIGYVARAEVAEWIADEAGAAGAAVTPSPASEATVSPFPVKVLRVEGRLPVRAGLRSQEYALTQPLFLITNGQPAGAVRQFIDFALSPAGQAIVNRYSAPIR